MPGHSSILVFPVKILGELANHIVSIGTIIFIPIILIYVHKKMEIYVKTLTGRTFLFKVNREMTVENLKIHIEKMTGIWHQI